MSGIVFGTTVGYLRGYPEVKYFRNSEVLNDCRFDSLAI